MAVWYAGSVEYTAVAQWAAGHTYGAGSIVRQLAAPSVGNERCFRTAAGGVSSGAEPTWVLTKGSASPADNTVTDWTEVTGNSAYNWNAPHARLANAAAWMATTDTLYVSEDHAETQASAITISFPGNPISANYNLIYCVNHAGSVPPVAADLRTTATVSTTGASNITVTGEFYMYGIAFKSSSDASAVSSSINLGTSGDLAQFEQCSFQHLGTANAAASGILPSGCIEWRNCTYKNGTAAATSYIDMYGVQSSFKWIGGSVLSGHAGQRIFHWSTGQSLYVEAVDFSNAGSAQLIASFTSNQDLNTSICIIKDCVLPTGVVFTATGWANGSAAPSLHILRSDSGATNYRNERFDAQGSDRTSTNVVRTGGASDGTTAFSRYLNSGSARALWRNPFVGEPIAIWNATTGSNVTVTVEGVADPRSFSALPVNDEFWFDVEYLGSASSSLGSFASGTKASNLATGTTAAVASAQAWDSAATTRQDNHGYSLGDVIKVADNSGRIFVCTTAGTSTTGEPAGYASAIDGGSVTDGGATFKAAWRFKQSITLSSPQPGQAGYIYVYPKLAKQSAFVWVDPVITLS